MAAPAVFTLNQNPESSSIKVALTSSRGMATGWWWFSFEHGARMEMREEHRRSSDGWLQRKPWHGLVFGQNLRWKATKTGGDVKEMVSPRRRFRWWFEVGDERGERWTEVMVAGEGLQRRRDWEGFWCWPAPMILSPVTEETDMVVGGVDKHGRETRVWKRWRWCQGWCFE